MGWGFGGAPIGPFFLSAGGGCGIGAGLGWGAGFGFGAEYIDTSAAFDSATGSQGGGEKGGRVRNNLLNVVRSREPAASLTPRVEHAPGPNLAHDTPRTTSRRCCRGRGCKRSMAPRRGERLRRARVAREAGRARDPYGARRANKRRQGPVGPTNSFVSSRTTREHWLNIS